MDGLAGPWPGFRLWPPVVRHVLSVISYMLQAFCTCVRARPYMYMRRYMTSHAYIYTHMHKYNPEILNLETLNRQTLALVAWWLVGWWVGRLVGCLRPFWRHPISSNTPNTVTSNIHHHTTQLCAAVSTHCAYYLIITVIEQTRPNQHLVQYFPAVTH